MKKERGGEGRCRKVIYCVLSHLHVHLHMCKRQKLAPSAYIYTCTCTIHVCIKCLLCI